MGWQHNGRFYGGFGATQKKLLTAAVRAADGKGRPPVELAAAWLCGENHLPKPGGMFDQDYEQITQMRILENTYNAIVKIRTLAGADIHKLSHSERILLGQLQKMGVKLSPIG